MNVRKEFACDLLWRWPRATSIQICLSSLISKHDTTRWFMAFAARLGRINFHESGDVPLISWKSFDIRNLAGLCLSWEVDSLVSSEWRKERVKEKLYEQLLEKNIGIRRVCRFWLLFILWYASMIYCLFWKILFLRVDEQLQMVTPSIFFQIIILTVRFWFLISNLNRTE